jgi:hypothetical protein
MTEKYNPAQNVANLRLPVPFFDLLMVLLVTCLVFVAPIPPDGEKLQAMDISIAQGKTQPAAEALLAVTARETASGWVFAVAGEDAALGPDALAKRATAEGRKVVVVVSPTTALQDFVNMQAAVSALHVPFALAIRHKEALP